MPEQPSQDDKARDKKQPTNHVMHAVSSAVIPDSPPLSSLTLSLLSSSTSLIEDPESLFFQSSGERHWIPDYKCRE